MRCTLREMHRCICSVFALFYALICLPVVAAAPGSWQPSLIDSEVADWGTPWVTASDVTTAQANDRAIYIPPATPSGDAVDFAQPFTDNPASLAAFFGYDSWRGHPDGAWGHNGLHTGLNFGTGFGEFSQRTGVGMQVGGSVGVYDWSGTDYHWARQNDPSTQGFFTYGLFRKASAESPWNAAIVHDWMFNDNFSVFAQNPRMYQWRGQWGYMTNEWTEYGLWGTFRGSGDREIVDGYGPVSWRPIQQLNAYWRHMWGPGGADTSIWVGMPEPDRITGAGSLGDYTAGASANFALSERLAIYTFVTYMHPSASPGPTAAKEDAWNFFMGVTFFPFGGARKLTLFEQSWQPPLRVANNGYFLVDASDTY